MSTHQTDSLYTSQSQIHRGLVQYSSTATGEIQVIIPSVTGLHSTVPVSYFGREAHPFENDWVVPNVGSSIVVCREDEDYTSVYWMNTTYNPVRADIGEPNDDDQDNPALYSFGPSDAFPLTAVTPTSSGLYLGSTHMGYYNATASAWRTFMDYTGNFGLSGSGTHALTWTAATGVLAIDGNITIRNASAVRSDLNVADGAAARDSAQDNPANYTFGPGLTQTLASISSHPTTAGLFLGANYMGYHTGTGGAAGWKAYMDSSGNFGLSGSGSHALSWNGSALTITGTINILNPSDVLTAISVTAGAVPNPTNYSFGGDATFDLEAVPGTITDDGLYLGSDKLGYHDGTVWKTYMDSGGRFYLGGTSGSLQWDGSTLTVTGNIIVSNASTVRGALNVADGAAARDSAQDNPSTYSFSSDGTGATFNLDPVPNSGAAGLHIGSDKLGFWNGSAWKTYMQSNGNFYLSGSGSNALSWNGSALTITGDITATSGTFTGTVNASGGTFTGTITGGTFRTSSAARLEIGPTDTLSSNSFMKGYTNSGSETYPGFLFWYADPSTTGAVVLSAPRFSGSIAFTGLKMTHNTSGDGTIGMGTPGSTDVFNISDTSGTLYTWVAAGNVGIGPDTSPDYKLDVQGTGRFDSTLSVGGTLTAAAFSGPLTGNVTGNASGSSGSCTGNAATATTATNATNVAITTTSTSASHYVPFMDVVTGTTGLRGDTGILYNPGSNTLTTGTFSGVFSGNATSATTATTATNATNVAITTTSTSASHYVPFMDVVTGTTGLRGDTGILYNPGSNTLTTGTLSVTSVSTSTVTASSTISAVDGGQFTPGFRFASASNTGMYLGFGGVYLTGNVWGFAATAAGPYANMANQTGGNYVNAVSGRFGLVSSRTLLKENISTITASNALTRIAALRPVEFAYKQAAIDDGTNEMVSYHTHRGFLAEEVASVDHWLADWGWVDPEDEYRLVNHPGTVVDLDDAVPVNANGVLMIADLVAVVQDLSTKLEAAESRIAALEAS